MNKKTLNAVQLAALKVRTNVRAGRPGEDRKK